MKNDPEISEYDYQMQIGPTRVIIRRRNFLTEQCVTLAPVFGVVNRNKNDNQGYTALHIGLRDKLSGGGFQHIIWTTIGKKLPRS